MACVIIYMGSTQKFKDYLCCPHAASAVRIKYTLDFADSMNKRMYNINIFNCWYCGHTELNYSNWYTCFFLHFKM